MINLLSMLSPGHSPRNRLCNIHKPALWQQASYILYVCPASPKKAAVTCLHPQASSALPSHPMHTEPHESTITLLARHFSKTLSPVLPQSLARACSLPCPSYGRAFNCSSSCCFRVCRLLLWRLVLRESSIQPWICFSKKGPRSLKCARITGAKSGSGFFSWSIMPWRMAASLITCNAQ